jgi:hypothetical protein
LRYSIACITDCTFSSYNDSLQSSSSIGGARSGSAVSEPSMCGRSRILGSRIGWLRAEISASEIGYYFEIGSANVTFFRVGSGVRGGVGRSSLERSSDLLVSALGFSPCFPGRYIILKLNRERNSDQRACRRFNIFVDIKYSRLRWSDSTLIGISDPSTSGLYSSKYRMIARSSLSYIS